MNVGQGDATLIIAPSGETILFDGGDKSTGRKVVTARLRTLGYEKIDYVIASHYDADHIGGLDDAGRLLTKNPVAVMDRREATPLGRKDTRAYDDYASVFAGSRSEPLTLGPGLFKFASALSVLVVSGNGCVYGQSPVREPRLDENASSLSIVLNYGTFDYFIGGDLTGGGRSGSRRTADLETPVASVVGSVDVLRLNHHGSATSSNAAFLGILDPKVAIISVGNGGNNKARYKHPRRSVLDRLHEIAGTGNLEKVYLTNRGETDGGLKSRDEALLDIVGGDIAVVSNGDWFLVNGVAYQTDARTSGATRFDGQATQTCENSS
jgi:beta-lactamase superfamily II metal-dependent hydrolase